MFCYYAERTSNTDGAGNVMGSVVKWSQGDKETWDGIITTLQWLTCIFFAVLFLGSFQPPGDDWPKIAAAGIFALGIAIAGFARRMSTVHCELTFDNRGRILMPRSSQLMQWMLGPKVLGDHRWISNIQIEEADEPTTESGRPVPQQQKRFEVWFYFEGGESYSVADGLFKRQAYQVAVLLEQALHEIGPHVVDNEEADDPAGAYGYVTVE